MSRFRVESQRVISHGNYTVTLQDKALALFSKKEHNAILSAGLAKALEFWLNTFLKKRFSEYARRLGYHVSNAYLKSKRKKLHGAEPVPLVFYGDLADAALAGSHATTTATKGEPKGVIRIPRGHSSGISPIVTEVLQNIPPWELERIAEVFGKSVTDYINNAETVSPARSRLTGVQRVSVGIKPRATYGSKVKIKRGAA